MQKKKGIKDTPELLAEDMLREGQGLNDPNQGPHAREPGASHLAVDAG